MCVQSKHTNDIIQEASSTVHRSSPTACNSTILSSRALMSGGSATGRSLATRPRRRHLQVGVFVHPLQGLEGTWCRGTPKQFIQIHQSGAGRPRLSRKDLSSNHVRVHDAVYCGFLGVLDLLLRNPPARLHAEHQRGYLLAWRIPCPGTSRSGHWCASEWPHCTSSQRSSWASSSKWFSSPGVGGQDPWGCPQPPKLQRLRGLLRLWPGFAASHRPHDGLQPLFATWS